MSDYLRGLEDALIYLRTKACKKCTKIIDDKLEDIREKRGDWVGVNIFNDAKAPTHH